VLFVTIPRVPTDVHPVNTAAVNSKTTIPLIFSPFDFVIDSGLNLQCAIPRAFGLGFTLPHDNALALSLSFGSA
jgi:hypothetical protein